MITVGEVVSRVRNQIKSTKQDAFLTDRFLYSLIMKYATLLMRRQDNLNRLLKFNSVFQTLNFVELEEVDKIEANCPGLTGGCIIKKTKDELPVILEGYWGPVLRMVSSLDRSVIAMPTYPTTYERIHKQQTFKYNKTKYYWYIQGHLYLPNVDWDAIKVEGIFMEDVSKFNCIPINDCEYIQDKKFFVPEFLFAEIEQMVMKDLGVILQVPEDTISDNRNLTR